MGIVVFAAMIWFGVTVHCIPGGVPEHPRVTGELNSPRIAIVASDTTGIGVPDRCDLAGRVADNWKSTPTPDKLMECGLPPASSANSIDPVILPTDTGENVTSTEQLWSGAMKPPQLLS